MNINVKPYCGCCLKNFFEDVRECFKEETKENIYTAMLLNTFNIQVTSLVLICEECKTRLSDATSFKEQVLKAQDNIKEMINSKVIELKVENDIKDFNDKETHFNDNDFMWDGKSETGKGVFTILDSKKDKETKQKNIEAFKQILPNVARSNKCITNTKKKKSPDNIKSRHVKINNVLKKTIGMPKITESKIECHPITQSEINSRSNTLKLIQNSNLCLFRSLKTRFGCFLCKTSFVDVLNLREHFLTHTNTSLLACRINKCRGLSFKNADISQLKCNLCSQDIKDLIELVSHLKNDHNVTFSGTNHFLIPYKLIENNQCVICDTKFQSFLRLSIHMNTHYKNNVCEICGLSFINRIGLRTHVQSMHKEKTCSRCPAKFLTVTAKVKHLKKVHNYFNSKRYCNLCDKTFRYTYLLQNHKIEEHGAKKTVVNCDDCGKIFYKDHNLKIHIRSVHKKERNYQCDICGTRFFTKCDQKRHERTHNDLRSFSCSYCDAKFKSKDSCRRHMKRQHGHVFPK